MKIDTYSSGATITLGGWFLRFYMGDSELCLFRVRLLSKDLYEDEVAVFEIAVAWFCITLGCRMWHES